MLTRSLLVNEGAVVVLLLRVLLESLFVVETLDGDNPVNGPVGGGGGGGTPLSLWAILRCPRRDLLDLNTLSH